MVEVMSVLWLSVIVISLCYGIFTGKSEMMNTVLLTVGKDTFDFVLPLMCVTCFWNGMFEIAKHAGLLKRIEKLFHPILNYLFPDIREDKDTLGYIATNVTINMFGLGSAATPAGLKAMEGLAKHNKKKDTASRSMVTFLVLNTGGVTLLSTTIISLRTTFHSQSVTAFMPYAIISTLCACIVGLILDRIWNYHE